MQLLGAHTSIAGGLTKAVERAESLKFSAIQIFTKNNNRWFTPKLEDKQINEFRLAIQNSGIKFVAAHDSYLINLCAVDKALLKKSRDAFTEELSRCELLGISHLNFHPGSHSGSGIDFGIKTIADSINLAHSITPDFKVKSMLEITAGQGTSVGHRFEHIASILDLIEEKSRMAVCIDTAHIFAAGYDIKKPENYQNVIKEFDDVIGLNMLQCFHMNDSKKELGSRVDRHTHIGEGFIGLQGFKNIMTDSRLTHIPKILETPKGKDMREDIINLNVLKQLGSRHEPSL